MRAMRRFVRTAESKRMTTRHYAATALLLLSALPACKTDAFCEELGKCGGDFLAGAQDLGRGAASVEWVATAVDGCIDQVPNPPDPPSLALLPPRPAGVRAVEPSTSDWCAGFVLSSDGQGSFKVAAFDNGWVETLKKFDGWFPSIPLYTAQLELAQNNQYALTTTQLASQRVDLSAACLIAQGISLSCEDVSSLLVTFVDNKLNGTPTTSGSRTPLLPGLSAIVYTDEGKDACTANADGGCSCSYNVSLTTASSGPWSSGSGTLTFFDSLAAPPSDTEYCARSGSLSLTGNRATDLFNRNSLKTLSLRAPSCTDGVQSKTLGETGVDCGGPTCPACQ
jgi:hypothetical protein